MKDVMRIMLDAPEDAAAPYLASLFTESYSKYSGEEDAYADVKRMSNEYMMSKLDFMRETVKKSSDRLKAALKFAATGNYIDFGALSDTVSYSELDSLLENVQEQQINEHEYLNLIKDMRKAEKIVYLTDNAGEIVADRVFLEEIAKNFPKTELCVAVRGGYVQNDATTEDAYVAGIDKIARVIDSGVNIGGTQLRFTGEKLVQEINTADVIISKGQGNFETLWGCGLNIYYIFLCKCERFTTLFDVPPLTGILTNEQRIGVSDKIKN